MLTLVLPVQAQVEWTFDDGPHRSTPKILALLDRYCVKATFFVLGAMVVDKRNPSLKSILKHGHRLGNHLWSHRDPCKMGAARTLRELKRTSRAVKLITGKTLNQYRPPFGSRCRRVDRAVVQAGYSIRMWNVSSWSRSPVKVWLHIKSLLLRKKKAIVLFHFNWRTLKAVLALAAKAGVVGCKRRRRE